MSAQGEADQEGKGTTYSLASDPKTTLLAPSPKRFILVKGDWTKALSGKNLLASGDIIDKLKTSTVNLLLQGDKKEVEHMVVKATVDDNLSFTLNTRFKDEAAAKEGIKKLNFIGKLPPKLQEPFKTLVFGHEGETISVHFAGTQREAKTLIDMATMLFFRRQAAPGANKRRPQVAPATEPAISKSSNTPAAIKNKK